MIASPPPESDLSLSNLQTTTTRVMTPNINQRRAASRPMTPLSPAANVITSPISESPRLPKVDLTPGSGTPSMLSRAPIPTAIVLQPFSSPSAKEHSRIVKRDLRKLSQVRELESEEDVPEPSSRPVNGERTCSPLIITSKDIKEKFIYSTSLKQKCLLLREMGLVRLQAPSATNKNHSKQHSLLPQITSPYGQLPSNKKANRVVPALVGRINGVKMDAAKPHDDREPKASTTMVDVPPIFSSSPPPLRQQTPQATPFSVSRMSSKFLTSATATSIIRSTSALQQLQAEDAQQILMRPLNERSQSATALLAGSHLLSSQSSRRLLGSYSSSNALSVSNSMRAMIGRCESDAHYTRQQSSGVGSEGAIKRKTDSVGAHSTTQLPTGYYGGSTSRPHEKSDDIGSEGNLDITSAESDNGMPPAKKTTVFPSTTERRTVVEWGELTIRSDDEEFSEIRPPLPSLKEALSATAMPSEPLPPPKTPFDLSPALLYVDRAVGRHTLNGYDAKSDPHLQSFFAKKTLPKPSSCSTERNNASSNPSRAHCGLTPSTATASPALVSNPVPGKQTPAVKRAVNANNRSVVGKESAAHSHPYMRDIMGNGSSSDEDDDDGGGDVADGELEPSRQQGKPMRQFQANPAPIAAKEIKSLRTLLYPYGRVAPPAQLSDLLQCIDLGWIVELITSHEAKKRTSSQHGAAKSSTTESPTKSVQSPDNSAKHSVEPEGVLGIHADAPTPTTLKISSASLKTLSTIDLNQLVNDDNKYGTIGTTEYEEPLINSPRSALVFIRNGINAYQLLERPAAFYALRSETVDRKTLLRRKAMADEERLNILAELRRQYTFSCDSVVPSVAEAVDMIVKGEESIFESSFLARRRVSLAAAVQNGTPTRRSIQDELLAVSEAANRKRRLHEFLAQQREESSLRALRSHQESLKRDERRKKELLNRAQERQKLADEKQQRRLLAMEDVDQKKQETYHRLERKRDEAATQMRRYKERLRNERMEKQARDYERAQRARELLEQAENERLQQIENMDERAKKIQLDREISSAQRSLIAQLKQESTDAKRGAIRNAGQAKTEASSNNAKRRIRQAEKRLQRRRVLLQEEAEQKRHLQRERQELIDQTTQKASDDRNARAEFLKQHEAQRQETFNEHLQRKAQLALETNEQNHFASGQLNRLTDAKRKQEHFGTLLEAIDTSERFAVFEDEQQRQKKEVRQVRMARERIRLEQERQTATEADRIVRLDKVRDNASYLMWSPKFEPYKEHKK